jgi:putative hydrolase of the HAD superfamily
MPKRFNALLFDLGGTLIYSDASWPEVMQAANQELVAQLQRQGLQLDAEQFAAEFRSRLEEYYAQRDSEFIEYTTALILRTLLADHGHSQVTPEMLRPALKSLYAVSQAHWKPEADALPTLEMLHQAGYRMAIISNAGDDDDVQTLVDNAGIRNYFDFVLTSAACGIRKPNPRIFELALKRWGISHKRAAMVGDTLGADILGANNAGVYSIWVTRRADTAANRDHQDTIQPNSKIANLAVLPRLIEELTTAEAGS